jgi:hypothetical protein
MIRARTVNMKLLATLVCDETGMVVDECPAMPGCVFLMRALGVSVQENVRLL